MAEHEDLQGSIPDYVTSRLPDEGRRRLEGHLPGCEECRELLGISRVILAALRGGGSGILSPHPPSLALREFALAGGRSDPGIRDHLSYCPSCSLEVDVWKQREERVSGALEAPRSPAGQQLWPALRRHARGLVAGLAVGAVVTALLLNRPLSSRRSKEIATPERLDLQGRPAGLVPLWILPGPARGERPVVSFPYPNGASYVLLGFRPTIPPDETDRDAYRFEIRQTGGSAVWSSQTDAGKIRATLELTEIVTLAVPVADLHPGLYEFRFWRSSLAEPAPILVLPFRVVSSP